MSAPLLSMTHSARAAIADAYGRLGWQTVVSYIGPDNTRSMRVLAKLDMTMLLTTFALSIVASLLAGLLPAWRAMQVTPAIQLKSQ